MNILDIVKICCVNRRSPIMDEYTIEEYSQTCTTSLSSTSSKLTGISEAKNGLTDPMSQKLSQLYLHVWLGVSKFLKQNLMRGISVVWLDVGYFSMLKLGRGLLYSPMPDLLGPEKYTLLEDEYNIHPRQWKIEGPRIFLNYSAIAKLACTDRDTVDLILKDILQKIWGLAEERKELKLGLGIGYLTIKSKNLQFINSRQDTKSRRSSLSSYTNTKSGQNGQPLKKLCRQTHISSCANSAEISILPQICSPTKVSAKQHKELELISTLHKQVKEQREALSRKIADHEKFVSRRRSLENSFIKEPTTSPFKNERLSEAYCTSLPAFMKRPAVHDGVKREQFKKRLNQTLALAMDKVEIKFGSEDSEIFVTKTPAKPEKNMLNLEYAEFIKKQIKEREAIKEQEAKDRKELVKTHYGPEDNDSRVLKRKDTLQKNKLLLKLELDRQIQEGNLAKKVEREREKVQYAKMLENLKYQEEKEAQEEIAKRRELQIECIEANKRLLVNKHLLQQQ